jgi:excisionase family DNA binding protein
MPHDHDPIAAAYCDGDGAAQYLGLSRTLVYRLLRSGEIRSAKVGRRCLVRYTDLDAFYESRLTVESSGFVRTASEVSAVA